MRIIFYVLGFVISLFPIQNSYAWQEGVDDDKTLSCPELRLNGAEKIIVRVKPTSGSYGHPKLVGMKGNDPLWIKDFPKTDEVNVAKFEVSCEGQKIKLWYQSPGVYVALVQEYKWNGKSLKKVRQFHE